MACDKPDIRFVFSGIEHSDDILHTGSPHANLKEEMQSNHDQKALAYSSPVRYDIDRTPCLACFDGHHLVCGRNSIAS